MCACSIWHTLYTGECACSCHPGSLTDDERADLALIARRKAGGAYADDMAPMVVSIWRAGVGYVGEVAPWRFAMEVD